jgi:NADH:ubiquinone oxidoreductase subunit F (NADH-binding)/NADH:ubiquinone oxidoreductase subunit E
MTSKFDRKAHADPVVDAAIAEHGAHPDAIVSIYRFIQARSGHLTNHAIGATAAALRIPEASAYGVATFYSMLSTRPPAQGLIRVCDGPACQLKGSAKARRALEAASQGRDWKIERTSCLGLCDRAPAALVADAACGPLTEEGAALVLDGWRGEHPSYADPLPGEVRVTMARIGALRGDPESIVRALEAGAYQALKKALKGAPSDVTAVVEASGLQGRGGAGFPAGRKWRFVAETGGSRKYIVCNFDESEPGTIKDRCIVDGDPHLLLEGMALAGYAVGSPEGYIYIRGEYDWLARRLERAITQAKEHGWLGDHIQGSEFNFNIHVHAGAGAYICGEETALLESLEGKRGEPRIRPPYPTTYGRQGKPTVLNNVETFCTVPAIVLRGADWYRSMGTPSSPGVKVFTVFGHVRRPGAFEAPYGITLRQIIEQFGGGMQPGSNFKMALTGGAAGTIVPPALLDEPLDFDSSRRGVALGSGAVFILDESVSVVTLLSWLLRFFESESCGKCTPCRIGTRETRMIAERIASGDCRPDDVRELRQLARIMKYASFCGLGQSVAIPVESALQHFGREFGG